MIRNIVLYILFPSLIIAFVLSFAGINQVASGESFRQWLNYVNTQYNGWSFQIPKINDIPLLEKENLFEKVTKGVTQRVVTTPVITGTSIGQRITGILNFLIMVVNMFIKLLNILIVVLNVVIEVIQFALTIIWSIKDIPHYVNLYDNGTNLWWYDTIGV